MKKLVNVEAVHLRSIPSLEKNDPIGMLTLGQVVDDVGDGPAGWHHICEAGGKPLDGFIVSGIRQAKYKWATIEQPTLRNPVSNAREALVAAAIEQWMKFDRGTGKENAEPYASFIGAMWQRFDRPLTGHDRHMPWSAVAISLIVHNAAKSIPAYAEFPESVGHARYIWESIRKATVHDTAATFLGTRLESAEPQIGDIVGSWRGKPFTYEKYANATKNPETPSHCDIVVGVGPRVALAIGGNVQNSVFATGYELGEDGFLTKNARIVKTHGKPDQLVGEAIVLMVNQAV